MTITSIEQIRLLADVAENLILAGYPIYTIYADQNEIHVDVPNGMPEPTSMESSTVKPDSHWEHRKGDYFGVTLTWLVAKQEVAA